MRSAVGQMGRAKIATTLALAMVLSASTPNSSEELLANPFGGYPPDYMPAFPDGTPILSERWVGDLLGRRRSIGISSAVYGDVLEPAILYISSIGANETCYLEPGTVGTVTKTRLVTTSTIGGCWRTTSDQNSDYIEYGRDLGGVRYGPFDCTRNPSTGRGTCSYTSASTGKIHRFSIWAEKYNYW